MSFPSSHQPPATRHPAGAVAQPRILLLRLSAIGDVVHGLPVLCALRDALPGAFLGWIVESRAADLLRHHPAVDELIVLRRGWFKSLRLLADLRRRLRGLDFDTAIDLQGLTKSAGIARLAGIPRRIGFTRPDGRELSRWLNTELVRPTRTHIIDRYLELLGPLGIAPAPVRFGLQDTAADASFAEELLGTCRLGRRFVVINPGGGWKSKLWSPLRFAAVARHLGRQHGLRTLVVWAGEKEQSFASLIVKHAAGDAQLAPATSLTQLAALARRATLFVASDTGPLHIAAAVGTPCVGLYGPMPAERNGPYGPQHKSVQRICLSGSNRRRRKAGPESMDAITIEDVVAACEEVLGKAASGRWSAAS